MGKPKQSTAGTKLLTAGVVLYLVAWLVPVFEGQQLLGSGTDLARWLGASTTNHAAGGPDWLPGWGACRFAWDLLVGDPPSQDEAWKSRVLGATCLSNLVMLFAFAWFAARKHRALPGVLLLGCAALDASWLYLCEQELIESLRPGYYLWLLSFVLTGLGALLQPTPAAKG
jgi:hypothetical protein